MKPMERKSRRWLELTAGPGIISREPSKYSHSIVVALISRFNIHNPAFVRLVQLALVGFVVHALLPREWRLHFFVALSAAGILLVLGLAGYGIKMTHKVAGPLFKVSLYLAKMRDGRFDKVWNLRKGDQLVDFYEHFKTAHAGVVTMHKDDIARLSEVIAAAEAAGIGDHPQVEELRTMLKKKEAAIE